MSAPEIEALASPPTTTPWEAGLMAYTTKETS